MIRDLASIGIAFLCAASLAFSQELNVLVIGSTHSFSEGGESGVVHEKPFNPTAIATHLQGILSQDPAITFASACPATDAPAFPIVLKGQTKPSR